MSLRTYNKITRVYACTKCILDIDCDIYEYDRDKEIGVLTYDITGTKISRSEIKIMMDKYERTGEIT